MACDGVESGDGLLDVFARTKSKLLGAVRWFFRKSSGSACCTTVGNVLSVLIDVGSDAGIAVLRDSWSPVDAGVAVLRDSWSPVDVPFGRAAPGRSGGSLQAFHSMAFCRSPIASDGGPSITSYGAPCGRARLKWPVSAAACHLGPTCPCLTGTTTTRDGVQNPGELPISATISKCATQQATQATQAPYTDTSTASPSGSIGGAKGVWDTARVESCIRIVSAETE